MGTTQLKDVLSFISACTKDDLSEVTAAVASRQRKIINAARFDFHVYQAVEFRDKYGYTHRGRIVKINRKTVTVRAEDGRMWRVTATLLRPYTPVLQAGAAQGV